MLGKPETEACGACNGTGRGPKGLGLSRCLRCGGAGKLTKEQLVVANMCSKLLERMWGD